MKKPKKDKVEVRPLAKVRQAVAGLETVELSQHDFLVDQRNRASALLERINAEKFEVIDDEDYEFINQLLGFAKACHKQIDNKRKEVTGPLRKALDAFQAWYKPSLTLYKRIEVVTKAALVAYQLKRQEEAEKAMLRIAQAASDGDYDAAHEASLAIPEKLEAKGLSVSIGWDYELVDLKLVPNRMKELSDAAVKEHIKKYKPNKPKEVPGIRFFKIGKATRR